MELSSDSAMSRPNECVFPGYTLKEDFTLLPARDESGKISNPDLTYLRDTFCERCQEILSKMVSCIPDEQELEKLSYGQSMGSVPFDATETDMRQSVNNGCNLCAKFLFEVFIDLRDSPFEQSPRSSEVRFQYAGHATFYLVHIRYDESRNEVYRGGSIHVNFSDYLLRHFKSKHNDPISVSNASRASLDAALSWLTKCQEEHKTCHQTKATSHQFPERLLHVGNDQDPQLRVVSCHQHEPYLTLSHCWGKHVGLTLRSDTIDKLTRGFDRGILPQLWRDCVDVTRFLGYTYVWIDSLCIQQDSDRDKAEEIAKMGDIYSGSACNIAAASSRCSDDSLFTRLLPSVTHSAAIRVKLGDDAKILEISPPENREQLPLYGRSWCVQERLLAPRSLEFSSERLVFSCARGYSAFPTQICDNGPRSELYLQWNHLLKQRREHLSNSDKIKGQSYWGHVILEYTQSALTFESDRQHALTGVINTLSKTTGLRFVHGVCTDFLPFSLLWWINHASHHSSITSHQGGPSWSSTFRPSASIGIFNYSTPLKYLSSAQEEHSIIKLTARCLESVPVAAHYIPGGGFIQTEREDCPSFRVNMDYNINRPPEVDLALVVHAQWGRDKTEAYGLVLAKSSMDEDLWQRIGMFTLSDIKHGSTWLADAFKSEKQYRIC